MSTTKESALTAKERGDLDPAYAALLSAGYVKTKSREKLEGFRSPINGHIIYVLNERSDLNRTVVMVNPALEEARLRDITGVEYVGTDHSFHAGMSTFPQRFNNGKRPETYGRQVHFASLVGFAKFLSEFDRLPPG